MRTAAILRQAIQARALIRQRRTNPRLHVAEVPPEPGRSVPAHPVQLLDRPAEPVNAVAEGLEAVADGATATRPWGFGARGEAGDEGGGVAGLGRADGEGRVGQGSWAAADRWAVGGERLLAESGVEGFAAGGVDERGGAAVAAAAVITVEAVVDGGGGGGDGDEN